MVDNMQNVQNIFKQNGCKFRKHLNDSFMYF